MTELMDDPASTQKRVETAYHFLWIEPGLLLRESICRFSRNWLPVELRSALLNPIPGLLPIHRPWIAYRL